jgi:hypothetical protein
MRKLGLLYGLLVVACVLASAQTGGQITGEVRDQSGAIVPVASVTVTNTATNIARSTVTNSEGIYSFPDLTPGMYDVKVTATGFDVVVKNNIELQVQQAARVDFSLVVGQSMQTIDVAGSAVLLNSENATLGAVIEQDKIADLPLNGRNFWSLAAMSPNTTFGFNAAAQASGRLGGLRSTLTIAITGARATWSNYTLDGITNTDLDFNTYILQPSVDAIQEFKVQTGIYPAEFGREAGQVNVSTRSGTNEYHGSAWDFLRNNALDARPYDFLAYERSATNPSPPSKPYRQNQYGFTLGGPVRIPKLFNGKNRLFFMTNFEGFSSRQTLVNLSTVLTGPMRTGDFSGVPGPLADPNSRTGTYPNIIDTPFANNQIPQPRLSADSVLLASKFDPMPNIPSQANGGYPLNNYQWDGKYPVTRDTFTERIDFNESAKSQWFGRYSWNSENSLPSVGMTQDGETLFTRAGQWVLSNVRTISPSKVNEARFGYNSLFNNITQQLAGKENVDAELNMPVNITDPNSWGIPNISMNAQNLTGFGNPTSSPFQINDKYLEWTDNFSWVVGKHSLRFGGEYRYDEFPQVGNEFPRGQFYFDSQFTNTVTPTGATTAKQGGGYTGADFMLGDSYDGIIAVSLASSDFRSSEFAAYLDDTWRVRRNLTISYGLRWELEQPLLDNSGHEVNVELQQPLPNQADVPSMHPIYTRTGTGSFYDGINFTYEPYWQSVGTSVAGSPPLQTVRGDVPNNRLVNTNYRNFAPRLGFAYSPSDKWSFRTGIGVFYSQESKNSVFDLNRGLGGRTGALTATTYGQPTWNYTNFINTASFPVTIPIGLTWGVNPHLPTTYSIQYLLNVQRALGKSTILEASYVGSQSRHLDHLINENQGILGTQAEVLRLPYPEFGGAGIQYLTADGNGNYNGFSARLSHRMGTSLTTSLAYTFAKSMDDTSAIRGTGAAFAPENSLCPLSCEYSQSDFNVPQRFVGSVLWALPFGRGQRFLNHGGLVNELVGGWQFTTITTAQSGLPTEASSWDSGGTNFAPPSSRLNCTGLSPDVSNQSIFGWYSSAAFSNPLPATFGNCGRNGLRDPRQVNVDFSTIKYFRLAERKTLEFRMEMFNALNHVELGAPNISWNGTQSAAPPANFGWITSLANNSTMRQIQFALKLNY